MSMWTYGIARSGMWAAIAKLNAYAQNIANVNTPGYKPLRRMVLDGPLHNFYGITRPIGISSGALAVREYEMDVQGSLISMPSLAVAIVGDGYFAVTDGKNTYYTRDGEFQLDSQGFLVDPDGYLVLDDRGNPINLSNYMNSFLEVGDDGTIFADGKPVAKLGVFVAPSDTMVKVGGNRYIASAGISVASGGYNVIGGFLEASAVNIIDEMTNLLEAQRTYQFMVRSFRNADEMIQTSINMRG